MKNIKLEMIIPPSKGTVTSTVADVRVEMLISSARGAPTENSLNSLTGKFSKTAILDCDTIK